MLRLSPSLQAVVDQASSQHEWVELLISRLGSTRTFIAKHSSNPVDVFSTGVVVINGTMTGEMSSTGKSLANLGALSVDQYAPVDMSVGHSVLRISSESGDDWIEGSLGLAGSGSDFTISQNLTPRVGLTAGNSLRIQAPEALVELALSAGGEVNFVYVVNDDTVPMLSGSVSQTFGVALKQGDVPQGEELQFSVGEVACPPTVWNQTYWPDGSLKFCAAMIRLPVQLDPGQQVRVSIRRGGTSFFTSVHDESTLQDFDIELQLEGLEGLSGVWSTRLARAARSSDAVLIGSGLAGSVWRVGEPLRAEADEAEHPFVYCWHYVVVPQNSLGRPLGARHLCRVGSFWGDVSNGGINLIRAIGRVRVNGSTVRTLEGTHPTAPGATTFENRAETAWMQYSSIFSADVDAKYDFVPTSGLGVEPVSRVRHSPMHLVRSRLVPAYDISVEPDDATLVEYRSNNTAGMARYMGTTGERQEIGTLPAWQARHILNPNAVNEQRVRAAAMATGSWRWSCRTQSNRQIVAADAPRASYVGLQIRSDWRFWYSAFAGSMAQGIPGTNYVWEEMETAHRPASGYYPYLMTGEQQYLDLLVEHASTTLLTLTAGTKSYVTAASINTSAAISGSVATRNAQIDSNIYRCGGLMMRADSLPRDGAWAMRDLAQAAAIYPDQCPWGTETKLYLTDCVINSFSALNDWTSYRSQDFKDNGIPFPPSLTNHAYGSPWNISYVANVTAHASEIVPAPAVISYRQHLSKWYESVSSKIDPGAVAAYTLQWWGPDGVLIERVEDMVFQVWGTGLSASSATNRITVSGSNSFTPEDGAPVQLDNVFLAEPLPARTSVYVVNSSGGSFQVAATPGGQPLTLANTSSGDTFWRYGGSIAPRTSFAGDQGAEEGYLASAYSAVANMLSAGDTNLSSLYTTLRTSWDAGLDADPQTDKSRIPKNAMNHPRPE